MRQDQPCHADSARGLPQEGLQGLVRGRRHRLAARGSRRSALRGQPRKRILRRSAGHQREVQPERARFDEKEHDFHQRCAQS